MVNTRERANALIRDLEKKIGVPTTEDELDSICMKHLWDCMGYNEDYTELTYIESLMGRFIDLKITYDEGMIIIHDIIKHYW